MAHSHQDLILQTSAAHGGTDSKNLKSLAIETETKMEI
jgi:hypothetical protein